MIKKNLFIAFQYIVPQHLLSRIVGKLAASEVRWIKNLFINSFIKKFDINMQEAKFKQAEDFASFNEFFTRELESGVRTFNDDEGSIISPADGAISQLGDIKDGRIFQAKGQDYTLLELLGGDQALSKEFEGGVFNTIYLSPRDYHRVHMPTAGKLRKMIYVPGDLFSVNQTTAENVPRLFSRNERLVAIFDTEQGPMAMVLVGAMIVAAIETVWAGRITPPTRERKVTEYTNPAPVELQKGEEMGRFLLGSTVVLCFAKDQINWLEKLSAESPLKVGEIIGNKT